MSRSFKNKMRESIYYKKLGFMEIDKMTPNIDM